jgi:hypothetical protein
VSIIVDIRELGEEVRKVKALFSATVFLRITHFSSVANNPCFVRVHESPSQTTGIHKWTQNGHIIIIIIIISRT